MNVLILKKLLYVALAVLAAIILGGIIALAVGERLGVVVIIIGVAAVFPVLGELYRIYASKPSAVQPIIQQFEEHEND